MKSRIMGLNRTDFRDPGTPQRRESKAVSEKPHIGH